MYIQGEQGEEKQLQVKGEKLFCSEKEVVQPTNKASVVGHKSYTADLYGIELLIQK